MLLLQLHVLTSAFNPALVCSSSSRGCVVRISTQRI
jgi:hypothetical protein